MEGKEQQAFVLGANLLFLPHALIIPPFHKICNYLY